MTTHKWQLTGAEGWQHGRKPNPPSGLTDLGRRVWRTWMASWWAAFWEPHDLPMLRLVVVMYERVMLGTLDVAKVVPLLDRYGITPKGRQDLRWAQAEKPTVPLPAAVTDEVSARRSRRSATVR